MGLSILNRMNTAATSHESQAVTELETPRQALSLDGTWQFRTDTNAAWRMVQVPGCWESQFEDLRGWAGTVVYERTFRVPDTFDGKRVLIHFDAVDYYTEVWVNSQFVGKHEGGYTPFAFDLADVLKHGEENVLTVRVTDCTPDTDVPLPDESGTLSFADIPHGKQSWYTPVSGIWQSVTLEARSFVSIERLSVWPDLDCHTAHVRVNLSRAAVEDDGYEVLLKVLAPEGAGAVEETVLPVPTGQTDVVVELPIPDPALWSPEHPNLYVLSAYLRQGDETNDAVHTRFGMRKIEAREGQVWLNNEPYFIIGALDQAFYPKTIYTAPSTEYLRDQFIKAKEMGLNTMRCHIKVPSTNYLDLCDELGLLVWYEVPNGQVLSPAMQERVRQLFIEMLDRDGNHPCIVIKTIMNESWGIDLGDSEQRKWLIDTYHWAKRLAPDKLIVDNSACIPNFHVISDLDDYHVYYNIPDRAQDFADWVKAFAERNSGTYSGYGDATRRKTEPLMISEFGNWGLPRYDHVIAAEGEVPWWFETGEGITKPAGVLQRFDKQKLGRAFKDYNDLADASQEQEWIALKYQIEEMRRQREVAGYVITELTDINWEVNGLMDWGRNPKVFHHWLAGLQQQDILIPRMLRHSYWPGELVTVDVQLSKFSSRDTAGGKLIWKVHGIEGALPVGPTDRVDTTTLGAVVFQAPEVEQQIKEAIDITLLNSAGEVVAHTVQHVVFAPGNMRRWGTGQAIWIHDPLGLADGLEQRVQAAGFRLLEGPRPDALALVTQWDAQATEFVQQGGKAILVALHQKSLQVASGLGLLLYDRTMNNWWGDWCSSQTWFVPDKFPYLPDTRKFDFEYSTVVPHRVLSGATPENVLSGLFVGWLRNPAGYVVRLPVGSGKLVVTTFDVISDFYTDPVATLMLACLAEQVR